MTSLRDEIRVELYTHVATMHDEATLEDAMAETERHADTMNATLHAAALETMHCPPS